MTIPKPGSGPLAGVEARRAAILELLRKRTPEARQQLEEIASTDPSPPVRYLARKGLEFLERGSQSVTESREKAPEPSAIRDMLTSRDPAQVKKGIGHAVKSGDPEAAELLHEILSFEVNEGLRAESLLYFAEHARAKDHAKLVTLLRDGSPLVRRRLPAALLRSDEDKSIPYLLYMLQDPDPESRREARGLLGARSRQTILAHLETMIASGEVWMRDSAVYAASRLGDASLLPVLEKGARDELALIRKKAGKGLAELAAKGVEAAGRELKELERREAEAAAARVKPAPAPRAPVPAPATAKAQAPPPRRPPPQPSGDDLPAASMNEPGGLGDANPRVRLRALETAIRRQEREKLPEILTRLDLEKNGHVVSKMIIAVGHLGEARHLSHLLRYLSDPDTRVVASSIEAIMLLGATDARARVRPLLKHKDSRIRANALLYLRDDPAVDAAAELRSMLSSKEYRHKLSALYALSQLDSATHWSLVETVLGDINDEVRERAFDLLEKWAAEGNEDAQAMLQMCLDGEVAIKQESLFLHRASPVRRVTAFLIDSLIIAAGCFAAFSMASVLPEALVQMSVFLVLAIASGFFFIRDAYNDGRGFGKKVMGLRTVDLASNRGCTRAQSLLRQGFLGLGLAGPVELVLLHTDPGGRRMGDWMVNTQVIDEKESPVGAGEVFAAGCVYLLLILALMGMVGSLFKAPVTEHRSVAEGYGIKLPEGWEFEGDPAMTVSLKRRSLLRGEEISGSLVALPRTASSTAPAAPEADQMAEVQKDLLEMLRMIDPAAELVGEPAPQRFMVSGKEALLLDVGFKIRDSEGIVRNMRVITDRIDLELQLMCFDRAVWDQRKREVEQLLAGVELIAP